MRVQALLSNGDMIKLQLMLGLTETARALDAWAQLFGSICNVPAL